MSQIMTRRRVVGSALAVGAGVATGARAQAWPSNQIRIIVGYPPGGLTDIFARAYGDYLAEKLGQPVIVENRPGASSAIAARFVKDRPADGYTLLLTTTAVLVQNRVLLKEMGYDPDKDFTLISHMAAGHLPLFVRTDLNVKNVAELGEYAKRQRTNLATFGAGTEAHSVIVEVSRHFGVQIEPVHYRGEAPMWTDVTSGAVQGGIGTYAAAKAFVDRGVIRPIAVPTNKRMSKFPDVATFAEQGLQDAGFTTQGFVCMLGPSGLPPDIVSRISSLMVEAGKTERIARILDTFGIDEAAVDHVEFKKRLDASGPILLKRVQALNIDPQ